MYEAKLLKKNYPKYGGVIKRKSSTYSEKTQRDTIKPPKVTSLGICI